MSLSSRYAICPLCGRGIGVSKNNLLRRHYAGASKEVCSHSGKSYKTNRRKQRSTMSEFIQLPVEGIVGEMNNKTLIDGVKVRQQRLIPDARGYLMEIMRPDWSEFIEWGQVYATMCYPGVVKGFHYHYLQIDSFNCVSGMGKVVLFDGRPESPTYGIINEFIIGPMAPKMVQIPNLVWHGFAAVGNEPAIIINCPTRMYNYKEPDEFRCPSNSFGYDWSKVSG